MTASAVSCSATGVGSRTATARPSAPVTRESCASPGIPGVSLMAGYLKDPEATAEVMGDGWLKTGDLVREDPDGLISFVARAKDMIKRAGENVAAGEIEDVLMDHPSVLDAAVIGVPDADARRDDRRVRRHRRRWRRRRGSPCLVRRSPGPVPRARVLRRVERHYRGHLSARSRSRCCATSGRPPVTVDSTR